MNVTDKCFLLLCLRLIITEIDCKKICRLQRKLSISNNVAHKLNGYEEGDKNEGVENEGDENEEDENEGDENDVEEDQDSEKPKIHSKRHLKSSVVLKGLYDNNEVSVNDSQIWSGDIMLTEEMGHAMHSSTQDFASARKEMSKWWTGGKVFYKIHKRLKPIESNIIKAMERWSNNTCIEFVPTGEEETDYYIYIQGTGSGCFSYVGMVDAGQLVSLDSKCDTVETVAHELGHALGMWHEHTRPDRDDHLIIYLKNVNEKLRKNFNIPTDVLMAGSPYDFSSVMHYDFFAFTSNNRMTMVPKDPLVEALMYNSPKPSYHDYVLINKLYGCDDACEFAPITCRNGGFRTGNKKRGCFCVCAPGFEGPTCSTTSKPVLCGGKYEYPEKITTPGFPSKPLPNIKCVYWIKARTGKRIYVQFTNFNLAPEDDDEQCTVDYLQVRGGDIFSDDPGDIYCGKDMHKKNIKSKKNDLILVLKGSSQKSGIGFEAEFKFI